MRGASAASGVSRFSVVSRQGECCICCVSSMERALSKHGHDWMHMISIGTGECTKPAKAAAILHAYVVRIKYKHRKGRDENVFHSPASSAAEVLMPDECCGE